VETRLFCFLIFSYLQYASKDNKGIP